MSLIMSSRLEVVILHNILEHNSVEGLGKMFGDGKNRFFEINYQILWPIYGLYNAYLHM